LIALVTIRGSWAVSRAFVGSECRGMTIKILVDMNLSPEWVSTLADEGVVRWLGSLAVEGAHVVAEIW